MHTIKDKISLGELQLNDITDEFVGRDIESYLAHAYQNDGYQAATCGMRCTLEILEDISPQKLCYDYMERLSFFNRGCPKFRDNHAKELVYIQGIEKVHAISTKEKLADEIGKLTYLPSSILENCDRNASYSMADANIDDEDVSLPMLAVIFFYEETIRATSEILKEDIGDDKRVRRSQLDPKNYGTGVSSTERCMGQYTRSSAVQTTGAGDADSDDDEPGQRPSSMTPAVRRGDEYFASTRRPKQTVPAGYTPIIGAFEQNPQDFLQIDKNQLPYLPALRNFWPTALQEMFMLMRITTGLNPTVYNLPAVPGEPAVSKSTRVSQARSPFLNPYTVSAGVKTNSLLCTRVQPQETLQVRTISFVRGALPVC
jgi:hypothetical protein